MIGILGSSPINTVKQAGIGAFTSLLTPAPSRAYSEGRNHREYVSTRGILIAKNKLTTNPNSVIGNGYYFQFNPQTIQDSKDTQYETRGYTGLAYNDYYWKGGGERIISFQLFMDNTPGSKTRMFRPTAYGSKLANEPSSVKNFGYIGEDGSVVSQNGSGFGQVFKGAWEQAKGEVVSMAKSMYSPFADYFAPKRGPAGFDLQGAAFSNTRIDERGILPEVELIQSFLYPEPLNGEQTPKFAEGGVVSSTQFRPPATVVFALGPIYLEGVIKAAPVTYTLFDKDLTPLRATMDIEIAVFEYENLTRQISFAADVAKLNSAR